MELAADLLGKLPKEAAVFTMTAITAFCLFGLVWFYNQPSSTKRFYLGTMFLILVFFCIVVWLKAFHIQFPNVDIDIDVYGKFKMRWTGW